jgi:hypothetical protein
MKLSLITFMLFLTACSGGAGLMDGIMSSWQGAHVDEVVSQWGYPDEEKTFAGRKLYIWNHKKGAILPQKSHTTGNINPMTGAFSSTTTSSPSVVLNGSCQRILEITNNDVVKSWQWKGNNCPFMELMEYSTWRKK